MGGTGRQDVVRCFGVKELPPFSLFFFISYVSSFLTTFTILPISLSLSFYPAVYTEIVINQIFTACGTILANSISYTIILPSHNTCTSQNTKKQHTPNKQITQTNHKKNKTVRRRSNRSPPSPQGILCQTLSNPNQGI